MHMREHLPTTPETTPQRHVNPTDLGGRAVASTTELDRSAPENPQSTAEHQESERKKNTMENLRVLRKRYGERFVKGDLMEGGGYIGGGARELLAGFMDRPDFASQLQRIIPSKYGSFNILKDNQSYIQAVLEKHYTEEDEGYEKAPPKDPYELARSVGYELTGPFESTGEFVPYDKQDFRSNERLCTFNNPGGRLKDYNILWLRHADVDNTLPADQLTPDNLSDTWKTYLRTIGRYDKDSDTYNIADLAPTRDDPYGISSMSVQVSRNRKHTHVSIKNRYNHTVTNPDNTLDSDLDNVAYGMRQAVYTLVGREDLMDKTHVSLADGYIADNEGGIHSYEYEENNTYYGDYEYIKQGVVTAIDRGKYMMVSPQLYVPNGGKGEIIELRPKQEGSTEITASTDVKRLYESLKTKTKAEQTKGTPQYALRQLREQYAERDHAEIYAKIHESLNDQARTAYDAYRDMAIDLGAEIMSDMQFTELFEHKMSEWSANGTIDYLVRDLIEHGSQPNLVATPNILADYDQIRKIGIEFGKNHSYETYISDDLYRQYSAEQLSGAVDGDSPVRLSIIPSAFNLEPATVDNQLKQLVGKQANQPHLNLHVPSVLQAITYWHTLRIRGDKLADQTAFDKTYIRHFDLPAKRLDDWLYVPKSCVESGSAPYLGASSAASRYWSRVAVG